MFVSLAAIVKRNQRSCTGNDCKAGNKQIAFSAVNHICDSTTALPGSQINLPNVDKDGVESVVLTYTETNLDGSKTKWVCVLERAIVNDSKKQHSFQRAAQEDL